MTNKELIEKLSKYPPNTSVNLNLHKGYYSPIASVNTENVWQEDKQMNVIVLHPKI